MSTGVIPLSVWTIQTHIQPREKLKFHYIKLQRIPRIVFRFICAFDLGVKTSKFLDKIAFDFAFFPLFLRETVLEGKQAGRVYRVFNGWLPNWVPGFSAASRCISIVYTYVYKCVSHIYRASRAEQCSLFIHPKSSSVKVQKQVVVVVAYRVVLLLLLIYLPQIGTKRICFFFFFFFFFFFVLVTE